MEEKNKNLGQSLKRLEEIVNWFEKQEEVDVEEGLEKVKEGAVLVKQCKMKLAKIENEFTEVKAELDEEKEAGEPGELNF